MISSYIYFIYLYFTIIYFCIFMYFVWFFNYCSFTALSHWIRGSGFPAYEVSNTTRAPRNTVVSQGPQSMVAGFGGCVIDSPPEDFFSSSIFKLLLNSMATSEFFSSVAVSVNDWFFFFYSSELIVRHIRTNIY